MKIRQRLLCLLLCIALWCSFPGNLLALTVGVEQDGNRAGVSGQASPGQWVTLSVERNDGKRCYLGQSSADQFGIYRFRFNLEAGQHRVLAVSGGENAEIAIKVGGPFQPPIPRLDTAQISVTGDTQRGVILADAPWSWSEECSVMDALKGVLQRAGVSYDIQGDYVRSIDGLRERKPGYPLSGWLFRVNHSFPNSSASSTYLENGDQVDWLYTLDGGKDVGLPLPLVEKPPLLDPEESKWRDILLGYSSMLSGQKEDCLLINQSEQMTNQQAEDLKQRLCKNQLSLHKEMDEKEALLFDRENQEVLLLCPPGGLNSSCFVTVKEVAESGDTKDPDVVVRSGIYEFDPMGLQFGKPVRVAIRLALTAEIDVNRLTPASWDPRQGKWHKIPGIIDLANGLVVFDRERFSRLAVLEWPAAQEDLPANSPIPLGQVPAAQPLAASSFADLDDSFAWAREAVDALAARGVISGSQQGFEPGREITRAELLAMLVRASIARSESLSFSSESVQLPFEDLDPASWYFPVVESAVVRGWASGYPDGSFQPDIPITRFETACLLARVADFPPTSDSTATVFKDDGSIPDWARSAVQLVNRQGIMRGYPDGSFQGQQCLSRAEAAVLIWKLLPHL